MVEQNYNSKLDPHYPKIVFRFPYRHTEIELEEGEWGGKRIYTVWVSYKDGNAVAVPCCFSRTEAIQRAKQWVDQRFDLR